MRCCVVGSLADGFHHVLGQPGGSEKPVQDKNASLALSDPKSTILSAASIIIFESS